MLRRFLAVTLAVCLVLFTYVAGHGIENAVNATGSGESTANGQHLVAAALSALMAGDYATSLHLSTYALDASPQLEDALQCRGHAYLSAGDLQSAHADFGALVGIAPSNPVYWNSLGETLRRMK